MPQRASRLGRLLREKEQAEASINKEELADLGAGRSQKPAPPTDIRINRYRNEEIDTREHQVQNVSRTQSFGFGVRALVKGSWGFSSSGIVTPAEVQRITEQAVSVGQAHSTYQRTPISLVPVDKVVGNWKSAFQHDPFDVPLDQKTVRSATYWPNHRPTRSRPR